jgi:hypothetical protein
LPGYEASAWFGIGAPTRTPQEIIERLNTQVNASLADANFQARLANLGVGEWRQWPLLARTRPPGRSALTSAFEGKSGPDMLTSSSSLSDPKRS